MQTPLDAFERDAFERAFEEGYLQSLRKSDFEVISEELVRDIKLARILPEEQRLKLAEMMRDAIDQMVQRYSDVSE